MSDKEYLYSSVAEQFVIGAVFKAPRETFKALSDAGLTSEWFNVPRWKYTYEAMQNLKAAGKPIDSTTVLEVCTNTGSSKFVGRKVFDEAVALCRDIRNLQHYLDILKEKLTRRVVHDMCLKTLTVVSSEVPVEEAIGQIKITLAHELPEVKKAQTVDEQLAELERGYRRAGKHGTNGIPMPWENVQSISGGAPHGKMIVMGARPKIGKTQAMCNWCQYLAQDIGIAAGIISLEMKESELRERFIGSELNLELIDYRQGRATDAQMKAFIECGKKQKSLPLHIYDGNRTIEDICMIIRDLAGQVKFFALDYIQRIKPSRFDPKSDRERLDRWSQLITDTANDTGTTILALAQLNREAEIDMKGKRCAPQVKNLKGSGQFEQDAHQVYLLSRDICIPGDQQWNDDQPTVFRCAYNRTGHTGDTDCIFQKSKQKIVEKWTVNAEEPEEA
jgi:replicative DNA helicase